MDLLSQHNESCRVEWFPDFYLKHHHQDKRINYKYLNICSIVLAENLLQTFIVNFLDDAPSDCSDLFSSRAKIGFTFAVLSKMFQQLLDGLEWTLVQTFMSPSGWIVALVFTFHQEPSSRQILNVSILLSLNAKLSLSFSLCWMIINKCQHTN